MCFLRTSVLWVCGSPVPSYAILWRYPWVLWRSCGILRSSDATCVWSSMELTCMVRSPYTTGMRTKVESACGIRSSQSVDSLWIVVDRKAADVDPDYAHCFRNASISPIAQILRKTAFSRKISLKSDNRLLSYGRFSIWRPFAILNFMGSMMGSLKSPCRTSY